MDSNPSSLVYRPRAALGMFLVAVLWGCVPIFLVIASVLDRDAIEAMDGFNRLLFSAVPIPLFCWLMAVIFFGLGGILLFRTWKARPTLVVTAEGLTVPGRPTIPWESLQAVQNAPDCLQLDWQSADFESGQPESLRHRLSAFDLGMDPQSAMAQIEAFQREWRPEASVESTDETSPSG